MYSIRVFVVFSGLYFLLTICAEDLDLVKDSSRFNDTETFSNDINQKAEKPLAEKLDDNDDIDEDYIDYTDETDNGRQSRHRNINFGRRVGISYAWGRWEKWSKCNGSCVQIRRRPCIEHIQNDTENSSPLESIFYPDITQDRRGCMGTMRKFRLCKDEKCQSNKYLRDEQCETFDKIPYKGKFYNWRGFEKEHNECELFCKPADSDVFVSMNQSVTNGTPCEKPAGYYTHAYRRRAVCVEGICRVSKGQQRLDIKH